MGIFDFFGNIVQGFKAANETRKLVFGDPQLFIYPILALISAIIVGGVIGSITLISTGVLLLTSGSAQISYIGFCVGLFVTFMFVYYVVLYFTAAMLVAFKQYVSGKKGASVMDNLGATSAYAILLLEWAIFYSILATILRILEMIIESALSRFGSIGRFIANLIVGAANVSLYLATIFALPVIIEERTGPFSTLKKSASFILKNFGNTFGGLIYADVVQYLIAAVGVILLFLGGLAILSNFMLNLTNLPTLAIFIMLMLIAFWLALNPLGSVFLLLAVIIAYALSSHTIGLLALMMIGLGIVVIWIGHLVQFVLFTVYRLIIYQYKEEGILPKGFDKSVITNGIKTKNPPSTSGGSGSSGNDPFS